MNPWYLLYCKRSEQERAKMHLERQGVDCYYPQIAVEKIRRGKKVFHREPLFPNYIFSSFDPQKITYTSIRSTRGVVNFVSQGAAPTEVPFSLVNTLMMNEENEAQGIKLSPYFESGDEIAILNGKYEGAAAIFHQPDGEKRSLIFIQLLKHELEVIIDNACITKV